MAAGEDPSVTGAEPGRIDTGIVGDAGRTGSTGSAVSGTAAVPSSAGRVYRVVDTGQSFPALEERILGWWKERAIFEKSLQLRAGRPEWVFSEGPPTANGKPGVHHVLARVFKDIYPRFRTMRGYHVGRKGGWDCHGLPVELEIEKRLGFNHKEEIEKYGVAEFNQLCKESVTAYVDDWNRMTERIGMWLDLDDAYMTMTDDYIESVWWILSEFAKQGLLYEGHKVVPYCPRCGTALSSHEVASGYQLVTDPSVYVRFRLLASDDTPETHDGLPVSLLVWTTTPWTLISNVAAAVGPNIAYARVKFGDEYFVLAADLATSVLGPEAVVEETFPASALAGRRYEPPYQFVAPDRPAWYVVLADYVATDEGTGIVHIAPAFGADDLIVGQANDLPVIMPVDEEARFTAEVTPWAGLFVKDADPAIMDDLESRGVLWARQPYEHNYPYCWRCDTPLIYYAKTAWYVRTTARKDAILAANEEVNWYPDHLKHGRFGKWLENNIDWSLSRERYWGTPLPVWRCEHGHDRVVGCRAELSELAGRDLSHLELHRPFVDEVVFACPECGAPAKRVPEVIDAWFDSGSMHVAQWHYPFENQEEWRTHFPADFICEAIDQTRGWFYSMLATSALLTGHTSYKNVLCLGHILDSEGQKMSKRLGNVVDPWSILDKQGADSLRWYLFTSSSPWLPRRFGPENIDEVTRKFVLTLWNTYSFYTLYANIDGFDPAVHDVPFEERSLMDRWILGDLHLLVKKVTTELDQYDAFSAGRAIADFVDELSNWYVRRSRRRFWKSEADEDKVSAYLTLYECLATLSELLAPFTPFLAEELYQNLVGERYAEVPESVHLCDWPVANETFIDEDLSFRMAAARQVVNLGRAARNSAQIKTRQPIEVAVVAAGDRGRAAVESLAAVVAEELNVKAIEFVASAGELVNYVVKPNYRTLGPRFGKNMPEVAAAVAALPADDLGDRISAGRSAMVTVGGHEHEFAPDDFIVEAHEKEGFRVEREGTLAVAISTRLSPELVREGLARELVHHIQNTRKAADFEIDDRINLRVTGPDEVLAVLAEHGEWVKKETLAVALEAAPSPAGPAAPAEPRDGPAAGFYREELKVNGLAVTVEIAKA
ncbi:MAG TPA: isoleucine--tRNA ligase [Thermoleophilia bacterium]